MNPVARVLLSIGAVLGTTCLLTAVGCLALGLRPLVFESGSMTPAIPTGSLALADEVAAADLRVGDVVSVVTADGVRVTHRISWIQRVDGKASLTLRGDANATPDADPYLVSSADRVLVDVPWLGYPVHFLASGPGRILLGLLAAVLLAIAVRPRRTRPAGKRRAARLAVPVAGLAAVSVGTQGTLAWFTDEGTVTGTAQTTHSVVRPTAVGCANANPTATASWPVEVRYDYEVVLRRESNGTVVSTRQVTGTGGSTGYTAPGDFGLGALAAGNYDFDVEVRSYLAGTTAPNRWQSPDVRVSTQQIRVNVVSVLGLGLVASTSCVAR